MRMNEKHGAIVRRGARFIELVGQRGGSFSFNHM